MRKKGDKMKATIRFRRGGFDYEKQRSGVTLWKDGAVFERRDFYGDNSIDDAMLWILTRGISIEDISHV